MELMYQWLGSGYVTNALILVGIYFMIVQHLGSVKQKAHSTKYIIGELYKINAKIDQLNNKLKKG